MSFLTYLFWPNPSNASYEDPKVMGLIGVSVALMLLAAALRYWRKRQENPVTKRLSSTWASAAFWFGFVGLILVVSRVEDIQFIAMRVLWIVWAIAILIYVFYQFRKFRMRHYEVLPQATINDPRDKYLPKKRKH